MGVWIYVWKGKEMKTILCLIIIMLSGCVTTYDIVIVEDVVIVVDLAAQPQKGDSDE